MSDIADEILIHYGMPRRSGRYPWGSGENPYQRTGDFISRVKELRDKGFSEKDIAKELGLESTTQLRLEYRVAKNERRAIEVRTAKDLREKGYSLNEIAEKMGYANDSSIRSLLNQDSESRMSQARKTADFLKQQIEEKGMIDVGAGVERELGITRTKLDEALYMLQLEGYPLYGGRVPQVTNPGKMTVLQVICPPGTEHKEFYDYDNIHSLEDYISTDGGESFHSSFLYPASMDSKRLEICYKEDGGINKDGLIELRRGVPDLSLGESTYAQVRILVDGNKYIKGMAVYADDLPDGVDVRFNTNKSNTVPKMEVLKNISDDPDNPFGSLIKEHGGQSFYDDPNGKYVDALTGKKQSLSLINKRAEEGDWSDWEDTLPSQFLSKQSRALIKKQLDLTTADRLEEYDEICALTNPTVKRNLLSSFADDCDAAAVHLKAAALPRQKYEVIIPLTSIKDNEVYAPNFDNGETVALIRFPHGGTFEIPILKVNNKNAEGRSVLGNTPLDAIGISKAVADRLSGADFDGDTVMVIPCNSSKSKVHITSTPALEGLKDFDPKMDYGAEKVVKDSSGKEHYYRNGKEYRLMTNTQTEMGIVSNLISDMNLKGAPPDELARAVRHSMVVIDAEKHHLDYKQSELDNDIKALKKKYQPHEDDDGYGGASTLISRAKSKEVVEKRRGSPLINQKGKSWYDSNLDEGALIWKPANETYVDKKTGKVKTRTQDSTKMAEVSNAFDLVSEANTQVERLYANYANQMKSLANRARKEMVTTKPLRRSPSAAETYAPEVAHLEAQLNVALKNAPRERAAQIMANSKVNAQKQANPDMSKSEVKKLSQQALTSARNAVGASRQKTKITFSDREWEAIQAGAVSDSMLSQMLKYADSDQVRERATPKTRTALSTAKVNKMKSMQASGYTMSEIADALGVSTSTVSKYLK